MKAKAKMVIVIVVIAVVCTLTAIRAEAGTGMVWIGQRTGWITINGDTYYIHHSRSRMYHRGEPCWDAYRWHGGKLYYFGHDGKMIKRSTKLLRLNFDNSIRYIYTSGNRDERYNVRRRRYQRRGKDGKWREYGMQTNVYWMVDWQW